MYVDTHNHLDDPAFDADRDAVIARAWDAGVERQILIGYRPNGWRRAIDVAASFDGGAVALGIHPQDADEADDASLEALRQIVLESHPVAIGETGIDLFRDGPELAVQIRAFAAQLELARGMGLPAIIHQRAAETDVLSVLRATPGDQVIVLHSFDAGEANAKVARERGWILGVGGLMTRQSSTRVREILRTFPLDQMVVETDAPYLVPSRVKARRNEPANVAIVAERLAELRGIEVAEVAETTTATAERVFRLGTV